MTEYESRSYDTATDTHDVDDPNRGIGQRELHESNTYTYLRDYSRRQAPIPSNHIDPTPYSRIVGKVTTNSPVIRLSGHSGGKNRSRYVTHLSGYGDSPDAFPIPNGLLPKMDTAESRALTIARDRLRKENSFNVSVSIAEARATAEMLADTGGQMARGLIAARQHAAQLLGRRRELYLAFCGAWLQGYYGWGSLARDAFALKDALADNVKEPLYISANCTSKTSHTSVEQFDAVRQVTFDLEGLVKVGYKAEISSPLLRGAESWGLINPLTVAWELVPFSFCVDWLVPVGNVLSSLTATAGLTFRSGYVTRVIKGKRTTRFNNLNPAAHLDEVLDRGNFTIENLSMNRRLMTAGFALPELYGNENPFSTPRITSGIALISQAILGR